MHPWRDRLARWFTPMARRCPLSPNSITLVALLLNLAAALCLYRRLFLPAVVLVAAGGWCDAFDGIVARVQNRATSLGDFFDHVADRISDAFLAAGWMLGSYVRGELAVIAVILVMLNGYIGTQIEATFGQRSYDEVGRGEFVLALIIFPIVSFVLLSNGWLLMGWGPLTIPEWMTLLLIAVALLGIVQRLARSIRLEKLR